MQDIISWLAGIEKMASEAYGKASFLFPQDPDFTKLLKRLSLDEMGHHDVLMRAGAQLKDLRDADPIIAVDQETRAAVEKPFIECGRKVEAGTVTKEELLKYIVVMEFSELNHLFLYVVNAFRVKMGEFIEPASGLQGHKEVVERYIETQGGHDELLKSVKRLPALSSRNILVVDDKGANVNLLKAILEKEGLVEAARDGSEALKIVGGKHFAAIVTDVDMPVMNGIEFYTRAVERYPDLKDRFIFFTAGADPERITFFKNNNLKYLTKPSPINEIRSSVKAVVARVAHA